MALLPPQAEPRMHGLQRGHTVLLGHHTAGADFAGGDQGDVDSGVREGAEHPPRRARGGGHAGTDGTHPCKRLTRFNGGPGPLGQQGCQGYVGAAAVLLAQDEADVAGPVAVLAFGLDDGVQADAPIR